MRRPARGFTLLELVVGMSVLVGIIGAAYLCLRAALSSQDLIEARRDAGQSARIALRLLAADLAAATPLAEEHELIGMDRTVDSVEGDNLDFAAFTWSPRGPGEGDFCEISYYVDRNLRTGLLGLWRRRDPTPDDEPLAGGIKEEIVAPIAGFRLEYYDGFSWYDSWGDTESDERTPSASKARGGRDDSDLFSDYGNLFGMPQAVRVTLALPLGKPGEPEGPGTSVDPAAEAAARPEEGAEAGRSVLVFHTTAFLNLAEKASRRGRSGSSWGSESETSPSAPPSFEGASEEGGER